MANILESIKKQYLLENRYKNFGPCIRKLHVNGFRGINNLDLNFEFPITVVTGLNGAGKSTLGQIAICAYKKPSTANNYKRLYIKDFFPVSVADKPIIDGASAVFTYETNDHKKPQEVSVTRLNSAWSGYKRQPERHCYYVGFTVYIPKVERRDLSVYGGSSLQLTEKRDISSDTVIRLARIIGNKYDDVSFQSVKHNGKESEIGLAKRLGYNYSENNMGFGEGRILYTVDKLENAPEQSLFILEEPETSLHESAQHEFAKYLLDVCYRRHHQIIITSHSGHVINALPAESRKMLNRDINGVTIEDKISSSHVKSILSDGHQRSLCICVEDNFAKMLLTEAIRHNKKNLLREVSIYEIGDKSACYKAAQFLNKCGKKAISVRDADVGKSSCGTSFPFPGSNPPEIEVFTDQNVIQHLDNKYGIDSQWIITSYNQNDHHKYSDRIANEVQAASLIIETNAIEVYVSANHDKFSELINFIQESLTKA